MYVCVDEWVGRCVHTHFIGGEVNVAGHSIDGIFIRVLRTNGEGG